MNILMVTNTYLPHVGGVARSVDAFTREYRRRGHRVIVIAPVLGDVPEDEDDVIRVPAIQNFNGSDFSVSLPIPGFVSAALHDFQPDIVHAHHPFLLGDTALRIAASFNVPLVFTHHTMYEQYTHYVPGDSPALQRFVIDLSTGYANLCDQVFAPSESVAAVLRQRGVKTPVEVVPTGVDIEHFARGDGRSVRRKLGIPEDAFVVGHLGRLAPEKNLGFLAEAVGHFLRKNKQAHFLIAGVGPSEQDIRATCARLKVSDRLHLVGVVKGQELVDTYHAMDVFAFASLSETQGMVLTEAMAARVPVVAVDAPGAREVVVDWVNGRLLPSPRRREFVAALQWMAGQDAEGREALCDEARGTAEQFSMPRCAEKALAAYEHLTGSDEVLLLPKEYEDSLWHQTARLIEAEWGLWAARAHAVGSAIEPGGWRQIPVLGVLVGAAVKVRQFFSRSEWVTRLFKLSQSTGTATEPGLILVQIDGLSRSQFELAIRRRRLPFLKKLVAREKYRVHTLYSGLPSSTPAVQGELFYGVRTAVPSFSFRDHRTGQPVRMFDPTPAARVQQRLAAQGRGLLEGGSAYSNIYSGGAAESHFCPASIGWGDLWRRVNPLVWIPVAFLYFFSILRIIGLVGLEFLLAVIDCCRGLIEGKELGKELKFVPTRAGIAVLLRELITMGACADAARGLPVIHVNFLGYDEHAHRRGPGSRFAHWTLKGIDGCVRRIWEAAHRSTRRDYQVWVYSDHGQELTIPYPNLAGKLIDEMVAQVFNMPMSADVALHAGEQRGTQYQRSQWITSGRLQQRLPGQLPPPGLRHPDQAVLVTAMGPLGHVYPPVELTDDQRDEIAQRLVREAHIPLVLVPVEPGAALAYTAEGTHRLPDEAAAVLGEDHPFLDEAAQDLVAVCHHPDSGALLVSGWRLHETPVSFPFEHGAHGGPGSEETRAFALLPADVLLPRHHAPYLRPLDLREAAFRTLQRAAPEPPATPRRRYRPRDTVRIVTYNVHSCIGMDGKVSASRIARAIAQLHPDIVALQELDVARARTGEIDQAHAIARELEMEYHFHPALQVEEEQYGDAVLSRFPMRLIKAGALPTLNDKPGREPRGALWVAIDMDGQPPLHLLNTHLGLSARERMLQIDALLGREWLGHPDFGEPRVVCGDFNAMPRSRVYRRLCEALNDVQLRVDHQRPKRTWPSRYPLGRIDHVFTSPQVEILSVEVPRSRLTRIASDHLPLAVEIRIKK